jgi:hypothetical protein
MSQEMNRRTLILSLIAAPCFISTAKAEMPSMVVNKSPTCRCCSAWIDHMRKAGFEVQVKDVSQEKLNKIKAHLGIKREYASCHTAEINGYFIEGHVPAADVKKLLSERPVGSGLAVPGMPVGSPGMEMGSKKDPFDTILVKGGGATVFTRHR